MQYNNCWKIFLLLIGAMDQCITMENSKDKTKESLEIDKSFNQYTMDHYPLSSINIERKSPLIKEEHTIDVALFSIKNWSSDKIKHKNLEMPLFIKMINWNSINILWNQSTLPFNNNNKKNYLYNINYKSNFEIQQNYNRKLLEERNRKIYQIMLKQVNPTMVNNDLNYSNLLSNLNLRDGFFFKELRKFLEKYNYFKVILEYGKFYGEIIEEHILLKKNNKDLASAQYLNKKTRFLINNIFDKNNINYLLDKAQNICYVNFSTYLDQSLELYFLITSKHIDSKMFVFTQNTFTPQYHKILSLSPKIMVMKFFLVHLLIQYANNIKKYLIKLNKKKDRHQIESIINYFMNHKSYKSLFGPNAEIRGFKPLSTDKSYANAIKKIATGVLNIFETFFTNINNFLNEINKIIWEKKIVDEYIETNDDLNQITWDKKTIANENQSSIETNYYYFLDFGQCIGKNLFFSIQNLYCNTPKMEDEDLFFDYSIYIRKRIENTLNACKQMWLNAVKAEGLENFDGENLSKNFYLKIIFSEILTYYANIINIFILGDEQKTNFTPEEQVFKDFYGQLIDYDNSFIERINHDKYSYLKYIKFSPNQQETIQNDLVLMHNNGNLALLFQRFKQYSPKPNNVTTENISDNKKKKNKRNKNKQHKSQKSNFKIQNNNQQQLSLAHEDPFPIANEASKNQNIINQIKQQITMKKLLRQSCKKEIISLNATIEIDIVHLKEYFQITEQFQGKDIFDQLTFYIDKTKVKKSDKSAVFEQIKAVKLIIQDKNIMDFVNISDDEGEINTEIISIDPKVMEKKILDNIKKLQEISYVIASFHEQITKIINTLKPQDYHQKIKEGDMENFVNYDYLNQKISSSLCNPYYEKQQQKHNINSSEIIARKKKKHQNKTTIETISQVDQKKLQDYIEAAHFINNS
jgi:hypothetical protein